MWLIIFTRSIENIQCNTIDIELELKLEFYKCFYSF